MKRAAGFTLIELMVTVAVMAVLAAAGMPFALSWMDSNRQMQARNLMWEGVAQARAVALRNPGEAVAGQVSARLERSNGVLQVLRTGSDDAVWKSTPLPGGDASTFKLANAGGVASSDDWACVAFDNRGHRVTAAGVVCAVNASQTRIAVGFSNQDLLYVDLL